MTRVLESSLRRIDANDLQRRGALARNANCRWSWSKDDRLVAQVLSTSNGSELTLKCRHLEAGAWKELLIGIRIDWVTCPFGGRRAFFRCPAEGCSRRGYILYGDHGFVCRTCRRIAYALQRVHPIHRALYRAQQLRLELGGTVDVTQPFPPRPKGMHEWTYTKRGLRIFAAERKASQAVIDLFGPSETARKPPSADHAAAI